MKAEDYLTQEMIDKLQDDVDENNGVIDWDDIKPLLNGFKEQLELTYTVEQNEQLRFLIDKFQTPKGNQLIDLLITEKERNQ